MLNFCDFIQVYVFTTNHHLKLFKSVKFCVKLTSCVSADTLDNRELMERCSTNLIGALT